MEELDDEIATPAEVSSRLGVTPGEFDAALGGPWQRLPLRGREHDDGRGWDDVEWWVAGDPPQALLGLTRDPVVLVAPPTAQSQGWELHYAPGEPVAEVSLHTPNLLDALVADVDAASRRRRRSFRWCRLCRTPMAPEQRLERDVCMGCGSRYLGVVY